MRLSPLTQYGIRLTALIAGQQSENVETTPGRRRAIQVVQWECPDCYERHDHQEDAEDCCAPAGAQDLDKPVACPVCARTYDEHREAVDCCLWKDLDAPERWRIADAVEAGSTWEEQLGIAA